MKLSIHKYERFAIAAGSLLIITILVISVLSFLNARSTDPEPSNELRIEETDLEEVEVSEPLFYASSTIGTSVESRSIEAHSFGNGSTSLLFVGGIHGGYEWNSIELAYQAIDYFVENPSIIPEHITIHIIPNLNPDGLFLATGIVGRFSSTDITSNAMHTSGVGRFNANDVDLNRNFDCKWAPQSSWRGQTVSAGTSAFSEPEAKALRDFVLLHSPSAVVFWHSQANNVYASECNNGILPATLALMNNYAAAGSYGAVATFDAYPITGDAEGWLASIGIPAITVELETRTSTEWERNRAGIKAVIAQFSSL